MSVETGAALAARYTNDPATAPAVLLGAAVAVQTPFDSDVVALIGAMAPEQIISLIAVGLMVAIVVIQWNTIKTTGQLGRLLTINEQNARSLETQTKSQRVQTRVSVRNSRALRAVPDTLTALADGMTNALAKIEIVQADVARYQATTDSGILELTKLFAEGKEGAMKAFAELLTIVRNMDARITTLTDQLSRRDAQTATNTAQRDALIQTELNALHRQVAAMVVLMEQAVAQQQAAPVESPAVEANEVQTDDKD